MICDKGASRRRAAVEGVRQVWPAVFASTMTTVLVFIPVVFVEEEAGQLYSDVAVAIAAAILASMLVAITVLPTAAARLSLGRSSSADHAGIGRRWRELTLNSVAFLLASARRWVACIVVVTGVSLWFMVALTPPAEYLPEGEEAKVFAVMNASPGWKISTRWRWRPTGGRNRYLTTPGSRADPRPSL